MTRFFYLLLFLSAGVLSSCTKKDDFINEGAIDKVGYYPVSINELSDIITGKNFPDTTFSANQSIAFELDYYSQDSIRGIDIYETIGDSTRNKIQSYPFKSTYYSSFKLIDTTIIKYKIPSVATPGKNIKLDAQITNNNTLFEKRSIILNIQ